MEKYDATSTTFGGGELPKSARMALQVEGKPVEFRNGQVWMLQNGKPVRIK
jgi:hypothetical protein